MVKMSEKYYEIREKWKVSGENEYYYNVRQNLKQVKAFIKDWIESWKENAEENEYKWLGFKTDNKTYAVCGIKTDWGVDIFRLKVIEKEGKRENRTGLSLDSFEEEVKENE